jgi:hypothetical protein
MNCFDAATRRHGDKWQGLAQYVHKGDFWPLMDGDKPKLFETQQDALIAAQQAVIRHMNSTITGCGERATLARSKAEALFIKGRKIEVEVRNGKRA